MCMEFMQLVGYSNNDQKTLELYAILLWIKYLWENKGLERCSKKGVYACLGTEGSGTALRSTAVAPQLPILPKRKQQQEEKNNTT